MNHPSLFDPPARLPGAPKEVGRIHDRAEHMHRAFLEHLRARIAEMYGGKDPISTDQAWALMDVYGMRLPAGASPNILGSLFSGWARAKAEGWTRSTREGAHGNLIRTWRIR